MKKIINKISILGMVVSPLAIADLKEITNEDLSSITGQAGVVIENKFTGGTGYDDGNAATDDASIQIESVTYKDEGGIRISNIAFGSQNNVSMITEIDSLADGSVRIVNKETLGLNLQIDAVNLMDSNDVVINAPLVSNVNLNFDLGETVTLIGKGDNVNTPDTNTMITSNAKVKINNSSFNLLNNAIGIQDFTFDNNGGYSEITSSIWGNNDGLHIKTSNIEGNIGIGAIMIGGESIGSMQIQNLRMAGMVTIISGKP